MDVYGSKTIEGHVFFSYRLRHVGGIGVGMAWFTILYDGCMQ